MQSRRRFALTLAGALAALGVTAGPARAAEVLKGHVKTVAANLESFVVTETGTETNLTITVDSKTVIETTQKKRLEMKELKPGDGVAVDHTGGLATKIVVAVGAAR